MTVESKSSLVKSLETAASQAGLVAGLHHPGQRLSRPAHRGLSTRARPAGAGRSLRLELSEAFDFDKPQLLPAMTAHLAAEAKRLRNPRPECYVTLGGLPMAFGKFQWPFHRSTSGADTYIVHGEMHLADGGTHNLHAKVAASVTVTFAEIVPAMEQPYAETFVYNAVRKTVDLGQLEFLKSGNRQPVPVTTRFYSRWQKKFLFTETNDAGAARVPAAQGLLALRRAGRRQAGVDRRPARRAVPEHDRGRSAAHGRRRGRRGAAACSMASLPRRRRS